MPASTRTPNRTRTTSRPTRASSASKRSGTETRSGGAQSSRGSQVGKRRRKAPSKPTPVRANRSSSIQSDSLRAVATADRFVGRRREIRREQGARRLRIVVALTAVSLLAVIAIGTLNSELADVDAITVVGNSRTSTEEITAATGITLGRPLLDLDLPTSQRQVERLPWIAAVNIDRRLDGQVVVRVMEREPVAVLPTDRGFVLIDDTGFQLENVTDHPDGFVPVQGLVATGQPGEYAPQRATLVLNVLRGMTPAIRSEVDRLSVEADELVIELTHGGRALLGDSSQLGKKIQSLETVLARVDLKCVSVIDLRVPSAAAVRRSESAEGACI